MVLVTVGGRFYLLRYVFVQEYAHLAGNVVEIEAAIEALDVEIEIGMISEAAGVAKKATLEGMLMLAGDDAELCRPLGSF